MSESAGRTDVTGSWSAALRERERELDHARRAASVAARHEILAATDSSGARQLHERMAAIHRQTERRHLVTARLYDSLAAKLQASRDNADNEAARPSLMAATAELAGSSGAIIALFGSRHEEALVLASDQIARRAHDLEFELGEGPALDAVRTRRTTAASGEELRERWNLYGPEVADLGVRAVVAVSMELGTLRLGSLTLLNPAPRPEARESIDVVSEALAYSLLDGYLRDPADRLFQEGYCRSAVHQAAGIISVQNDCSVDDALALMRARSFAEGGTIEAVARDIMRGEHEFR